MHYIHDITLHYMTLHDITLHYITLHDITHIHTHLPTYIHISEKPRCPQNSSLREDKFKLYKISRQSSRKTLGVSEMASAKMASAIDVRIDDVGSILKFRIGSPFGGNSAGFCKSVWLPGSILNFRIGSVSSIVGSAKLTRSGLNEVSERDVWKTKICLFRGLIKILYLRGENCLQNAPFLSKKSHFTKKKPLNWTGSIFLNKFRPRINICDCSIPTSLALLQVLPPHLRQDRGCFGIHNSIDCQNRIREELILTIFL